MKTALMKSYPQTIICNIPTCKKHGIYTDVSVTNAHQIPKMFCTIHHCTSTMRKLVVFRYDLVKTIMYCASRGFSSLLKHIFKQDVKKNVSVIHLRDNAVQHGQLKCARFIIDFFGCHEKISPYTIMEFFNKGNIEAIKTSYTMGNRLKLEHISVFCSNTVKYKALKKYTTDNIHWNSFQLQTAVSWELYLAYYYRYPSLYEWLHQNHGMNFDTGCFDMIVLSTCESTYSEKKTGCGNLINYLIDNGWRPNITILFHALTSTSTIFSKLLNLAILLFNEYEIRLFMMDLFKSCIEIDQLGNFKQLYQKYCDLHIVDTFDIRGFLLEYSIINLAHEITKYLALHLHIRVRPENSNILPPGWQIRNERLDRLRIILIAGVKLPDHKTAFEMSMENGNNMMFFVGSSLMKSPLYGEEYFKWINLEPYRIRIFLNFMSSRWY